MANEATLRASWARVIGNWPIMTTRDEEVQAATAQNFVEAMREFDDFIVSAAVAEIVANSTEQYPPPAGAFRQKALALIERAEAETRAGAPTASEAWQLLARCLHPYGHGGYQWDDGARERLHPHVVLAAQRFGEQRFANRLTDQEGTDFAQFRGIYEQVSQREVADRQMLPGTRKVIGELATALSASTPRHITGAAHLHRPHIHKSPEPPAQVGDQWS